VNRGLGESWSGLQDKLIPYGENYIEEMFVFWYNSGRIPPAKLIELEECPKDQFGRIPVRRIVEAWVNERGWRERADILDARAATQIEDELVALKVNALRKQAAQAAEVRQKAFEHIIDNPFDSSASAVSAFLKSAELERITLGMSKYIERLSQMDDDELMQSVKELAERAGSTIIDADSVSQEEDAESFDT
jgi:hypothetical protein